MLVQSVFTAAFTSDSNFYSQIKVSNQEGDTQTHIIAQKKHVYLVRKFSLRVSSKLSFFISNKDR